VSSPVAYYLYCHSLELVLKAFLLAKGVSIRDLPNPQKFGHDLLKILREAKKQGLEQTVPLTAYWLPEIQKANVYYKKKKFEYYDFLKAVPAYRDLPALDILNQMVTTYLEGLEQICIEA
jgi:hypothetical protein